MSLRELQWKLQEAKGFEKPKIGLEQYNTSAELASNMMYLIDNEYNEIEDLTVADFGCGTGVLAIAADLLGAGHVVGFDIDPDALAIAQENNEHFETNVDFVRVNIDQDMELHATMAPFDVIVMNPPFGTKKHIGIDARFVQKALQFAPVVYSLHKTSTRKYFQKNYKQWGATEMDVVAELRFDLPKTYKFHKKNSVDVFVDLYRFSKEANK